MGRAGAGVAAPCDDGSAMFFNPAGLALDMHPVISAGVTGVAPRGSFTDFSNNKTSLLEKTYPVPTAYGAAPIGKRLMVGVGLFAPYGLTSEWAATSAARYLGYYSSVKAIYIQPTVAVRLSDNVMIGGGIDITHVSADLRQRFDLSTITATTRNGVPITFGQLGVPAGTDFADVQITGNTNHVGGHIGFLGKGGRASIGARYLFHQTVAIDNGQFNSTQIPTNIRLAALGGLPVDALVAPLFASGQPLGDQTASTSLPLPDQFVVGVAFDATEHWKVFADYQYTHWKMFDVLTVSPQYAPDEVTVENYSSTSGVRIGTEYSAGLILRLGFDAHNAAAPDENVTPRLPEANRWEVAGGIGIPAGAHARFDLAYLYVHQSDRQGRTVPEPLPNNGTYHYYANLFSGSLVLHF